MKVYKNIKLVLFVLLLVNTVHAQDCNSLSGIVNTYAPVSAIAGNIVTIGATSGAAAPFATGDKVVLIQMTGIPPVQTGSNMGKYELRSVTTVSGSSITLDGIVNTYTTSEKVQLVRAPSCPTGTISAEVTGKVWDGTTGGIIAIVGGTLTMNANIDATGTGFSQANPPTLVATTSLSSGQGSINGRGGDDPNGGGKGGGGIGGGGGNGGISAINGGGVGSSFVVGGSGGGSFLPIGAAGSGGGTGIFGGGGGGGGAGAGGGGGGVAGGGGGGTGVFGVGGGGGGGGVLGIGNGGKAVCTDACSGAGGGSYGGGGGAASALSGGDDSCGGGGGGGWTGGGVSGKGGTSYPQIAGNGNIPVTIPVTNTDHYLNTSQPRLMMGGAGGNAACQSEGLGGGIILLDFTNVLGNNNNIKSNGESKGIAPSNCVNQNYGIGGAGGGGGGQILLNVKNFNSYTNIEVKGGKGGDGNYNPLPSGFDWHGGTGGAGGGGGGIWIYSTSYSTNTGGQTVTVANTNLISAGNSAGAATGGLAGSNTLNPKNSYLTGTGGAGGNGLIVQSPDIPSWPASCAINLTAEQGTCNSTNNQYVLTGTLTVSNPPATGTLIITVSGGGSVSYPVGSIPASYSITGLNSDGALHTVTATFSDDATCTNTATYTAPVACQCLISALTAAPTACSNTNNTYVLNGQVSFTNAPASGTLVISVSGGNSVTLNAPFTSPLNYSIANLNADGTSHTVIATFSDDILCTLTQSYTAPVQCSTPCPPSSFDFCGGDSYTLTAPVGYTGYQWYILVGTTETPISGATSNVYIATMPGTYIYRASDGGNCPIELCCPITFNDVRPLLSCTATTIPSCGMSNGSASVTATGGAGGYTYIWSTIPQQTSSTANNLAAGTYTVTVTDSGSCTNTCTVILATPNNPTCIASVLTSPGCGLTNGSATVSASGGVGPYTFLWSTTPVQTGMTATGLAAGTYTVTVTGNDNCTSTCSTTLVAPGGPTCTLVANTQPSCANLNGGSVTVTGAGGQSPYTFQWSNGQSGTMATGMSGGIYTVTVTDANNCSSTCSGALTTPMNCCNISAIVPTNLECIDNNTPSLMTDNRIRFTALVTNTNATLTSYNVTINGGTTITPNTNVPYGVTQFILGPGTAGGGATFTVTVTDSVTPGCTQTFQVVDPGTCTPGTPECPPVQCGAATIQTNGN